MQYLVFWKSLGTGRQEHILAQTIKKRMPVSPTFSACSYYVPGGIRTPDRCLRRALLYPAELLRQIPANTGTRTIIGMTLLKVNTIFYISYFISSV